MGFTLHAAAFALLFSVSFSLVVHAQRFRPIATADPCSAYVEGQGLYVIGGVTKKYNNFTSQAFVLDLSVSWNTSDPIFKELPNGPWTQSTSCTMFNNEEDLFVLSKATGYIYNVKSNSWTVMHDNNFVDIPDTSVATDLESGMVYITNGAMNFTGDEVVLALDMKTKTSSTIPFSPMRIKMFENLNVVYFTSMAWCAYLRSFLLNMKDNNKVYTFTPREASGPSGGWGALNETTGFLDPSSCFSPAYGGSKMVYFGEKGLRILDVATQTWKVAPRLGVQLTRASCAVSGDQFIIWGGQLDLVYAISARSLSLDNDIRVSNMTYVYNMKTEKWTSRYVAPPARPITTSTHASEASQTPSPHAPLTTTTPGHSDASLSDKKLVNIIIIVIGAMMTIILTIIFVYLGLTKRGSLDTRSEKSSASRPLSEHPHAIVEDSTTNRNVQEGAVAVLMAPQHPHTIVEKEFDVE
ncbi:MAG: hypothetical protein J3Q66DRAFT_385280 [Benniella sp.]|nr:MAG: hypothetical protein J3Q66DRAFT_385280 [Benniella sp.]